MSEASSGSQAVLDPLTDVEPGTTRAPIWITVVFNDPVNLMNYVTYVFQEYFGYSRTKAEELMMQVHEAGRSIVSRGSREEMERDTQAMHEYGLWASARPAGEEDA